MSETIENHPNVDDKEHKNDEESQDEQNLGILMEGIVTIAGDFSSSLECPPLNQDAVRVWIEQFDEEKRVGILQEVKLALENFYISRNAMRTYFSECLQEFEEYKTEGVVMNEEEARGDSQKFIVDDILLNETGDFNGESPSHFIYFDDLAVTGNTIKKELIAKAKSLKEIEGNFCFHIRVYGDHLSELGTVPTGIWALQNELEKEKYGGKFSVDYKSKITVRSDCYWSNSTYPFCSEAFVEKCPLAETDETDGRAVWYGPYGLIDQSRNRLCPRGFGTPFVTFRNCPNNAPLALWYTKSESWRPLFPRYKM